MVKKRVGHSNSWELVPADEADSKWDNQSRKWKRKPQSESSEEEGEQEDGKLDNQSRKQKSKPQSSSSSSSSSSSEEEEVEEPKPENQSLKQKCMADPASDDEQNRKPKKKSSKPEPIVKSTIIEVESKEEFQEVKKPPKQPAEAKDQDVSSIKRRRVPDLPLVVQECPTD